MEKIIDYIINNKMVVIIYLIPVLLVATAFAANSLNLGINTSNILDDMSDPYKYPITKYPIPKTGDFSIIQKNKECWIEYEVKKGDTLKSIWADNVVSYPYNITVGLILKQNKMESFSDIEKGNVILIPIRTDETCETYTVKKGDTLLSIAKRFKGEQTLNNMVKTIADKNGKDNVKNIEPGQTLLIPWNT